MSTSDVEKMANILKEEEKKLLAEVSNKIKKKQAFGKPETDNQFLK